MVRPRFAWPLSAMSDTVTHEEFLFEGDLMKLGWTSPTWTKRYFEVSKRGIVT